MFYNNNKRQLQISITVRHECSCNILATWCPFFSIYPAYFCVQFFNPPVCVLKCRVNSSDLANLLRQCSHLQTKGFSPGNKTRICQSLYHQNYSNIIAVYRVIKLFCNKECRHSGFFRIFSEFSC